MATITFKPGADKWICRNVGHKFGDWTNSRYGNSDFEVTYRECVWCEGQEWRKQSKEEIRAECESVMPHPPAGFLDDIIIPGHRYVPKVQADPTVLSVGERERWYKKK